MISKLNLNGTKILTETLSDELIIQNNILRLITDKGNNSITKIADAKKKKLNITMTHKPVKYFVFYNKQNIHLTETRTLPNTLQIRQFSNNQPIQPPKRSKSNSNPFLRGRPEKN